MAKSLQIDIESGPDRRGIVVRICNISLQPLLVTIPHPRDSVFVLKDSHEMPKEFYPLRWESMGPQSIAPDNAIRVAIRLIPYWLSLQGVYTVLCRIVSSSESQIDKRSELHEVRHDVVLNLPSQEELRAENRARRDMGIDSAYPIQEIIASELRPVQK